MKKTYLPYLTLPLPLPYLTLPYLTLPYLTLPYLTYPTLPYLPYLYLTLPYPTLPYLTLPYPYLTLTLALINKRKENKYRIGLDFFHLVLFTPPDQKVENISTLYHPRCESQVQTGTENWYRKPMRRFNFAPNPMLIHPPFTFPCLALPYLTLPYLVLSVITRVLVTMEQPSIEIIPFVR